MAPKKRVAPIPAAARKGAAKPAPVKKAVVNPLYEKRPKIFGTFRAGPTDGFPPAINRFTKTADKSTATALFKLLLKYRPEDRTAKKQRLLAEAEARTKGVEVEKKRPVVVKYGINHVTQLIESGKAQLVVIAHDVDPLEIVVWLPTLCKKMGIPYVIVKGKARLGTVVHKKNAAAVCLTAVKNEDQRELAKIVEAAKALYEGRVSWGGGIMGAKSQAKTRKRARAVAREAR
ncbi:hypothetical protein QBZ16_002982 [Prototheca wickerhamii]|uniref:60S ribosomal protein L7a n=1 Tax=Prototheca wickerhamii TaxID=3111 RepID=A0AAD9MNQ9_PROWI|nr:hypothetical protein QBZ16_002982 [Prototheca wickerhamii]